MGALSISAQEAQQQLMLDNLEAFFAGRPVLTPAPLAPAAPSGIAAV
jgi:hypothetical protein